MDFCTQTLLSLLQDSEGYDATSPYTIRLAKKLSKENVIQHYINGLQTEVSHELEKTNPQRVRRTGLKKLKSSSRQLKSRGASKMGNSLSYLPILEPKFKVPNLTAGKKFKEIIKTLDDLQGTLQFYKAKGCENITGLSIDESNFTIEGQIESGGDYELELLCILLLPNGEKQKVQGKLKITVIPDPRSLWKDIDPDSTARFHKPNIVSGSCETEDVTLMAASVRGRSHAHKGTHRDDDIKISCASESKWNVICVADGAGSCQYSRKGSELAVLKSTETLRESLDSHYGSELEKLHNNYLSDNNEDNYRLLQEVFQHTIVKAVYEAAKAIQDEVKKNKEDTFKDYSTTLLLAAHKPVNEGHLIMSFWIGDGAAVLYDKEQSIVLLGEPDSGEYAGQTRFLDIDLFDDESVYSRVKIQKVDSMTALILATDGITDAKFETEKQLSSLEHWDNLWLELEPFIHNSNLKNGEDGLTKWMDFWSPGNHDDRSIAICYIRN
jgi:serine/threonine protein phosphatase PrpC